MYKIQSRLKNAIVKEEFTPDISQVSKKKKKSISHLKKKKLNQWLIIVYVLIIYHS